MNSHHHAVAAKATVRRRSRGTIAVASFTICATLLAGCGGGDNSANPASQQGATGTNNESSSAQGRVQAAAVSAINATEPYVTDAMSDARAGIQVQTITDWDTSRLYYRPTLKGVVRYVDSNTGQDVEASAGGGTMAKPWKSLNYARQRLNGVNMLLLRCGGIWRESLSLYQRPSGFVLGAYDVDPATPNTLKFCTGDKRPVIMGSNALTPDLWQPEGAEGSPIYRYALAVPEEKAPTALYYMGRPMQKARWPNLVGPDANWPRTGGVIGKEFAVVDLLKDSQDKYYRDRFKVTATDLAILQDKDLIGATVHVRTQPWLIESAKVTGFDKVTGVVTLGEFYDFWGKLNKTGFSNDIMAGSGYILEGKRWMLDTPGEWLLAEAAAPATPALLAWLPLNGAGQTQDPRKLAKPTPTMAVVPLEITVRDKGVIAQEAFGPIQIERVQVDKHGRMGIEVDRSPGVKIKDVTVRYVPIGISASRSRDDKTRVAGPNIQQALVQFASHTGISVVNYVDSTLSKNQVLDTGIYTSAQGFEMAPSEGAISAIQVNGEGVLIDGNLVNRSSNAGIIAQNSFTPENGLVRMSIQNNTVRRPCVRVSDCGGIYVSGYNPNGETGWPVQNPSQGATISNNVIYNAASNLDGNFSKALNGTVGIYLDVLSARTTVRDNHISGTEIGIKLHDAYANVVSGNTVRNVGFASLQAGLSRSENVLWGNTVEYNHFYSQRTMTGKATLPSGTSPGLSDQMVFAQQWGRDLDPDGNLTAALFQPSTSTYFGTMAANVSRHNDVLTTAGSNGNSWHIAQNGTLTGLTQSAGAVWTRGVGSIPPQMSVQEWQAMTGGNDTVLPTSVAFKPFTTTGTSEVPLAPWGSYLSPSGTGSSVQYDVPCPSTRNLPAPQALCVRFVAGTTSDYLFSKRNGFTIDTTDNLYLASYTVEAGSGGANPRAFVRQFSSPWTNLGLNTPNTTLQGGQVMRVAQFFRFSQSDPDAVLALYALPLTGQVNPEVFYSQISLTKVPYQGLSLLSPATLRTMTRHVLNPSSQAISLSSCEALGWPTGCTVLNEQGQAVTWPISVPARGGVFLLRRDDTWMQFAGS